ncbi:polysaccharide lyase family 8 super-sandwich domain-containing protein [Endozoicomonas sp. SESOKO1]|uniref:polysaccharide lyase family 8 super-sandwich domain-containing protein n=1 Tax=Endozoicomonas sp. SESOKO1 TaxID=2828742 RepID=UPI0021480C3B|nr:polysaccharide lyase family 8 super-sandwich domain-containing protein [Endozoicomonas sp. SESOKO1]
MKKIFTCIALAVSFSMGGSLAYASASAQSTPAASSADVELDLVRERFASQNLLAKPMYRVYSIDNWSQSLKKFDDSGEYSGRLDAISESEKHTNEARLKFRGHADYLKDVLNVAFLYGYNDGKRSDEYFQDPKYRELVINSLDWWFSEYPLPTHVYHSTFGYHNQRGVTDLLSTIAHLVFPNDSQLAQDSGKAGQIKQSIIDYGYHSTHSMPQLKGPNWTARSHNAVRYLLLADNTAYMDEYMAIFRDSLTLNRGISNPEVQVERDGIWPDWSLTHHGDMNYWGMYGVGWLYDVVWLAELVADTRWEFTDEDYQFIESAIVNGLRWIFYRGNTEYTTAPKRSTYLLARTDSAPGMVKDSVHKFIGLAGDAIDQEAMQFLHDNLDTDWRDDGKTYQELVGHRMFWNTDYQVHRRNNYSVAVRRSSLRTRGPEDSAYRGVNLHLHFGSGYTSILTKNDEYRLARMGMDYSTMPGTTLEQGQSTAAGKAASLRRNLELFSAGVTDGMYGVGAMKQQLVTLQKETFENPILLNGAGAYKSNFFFENEIVNLGSEVKRLRSRELEITGNILTTVNQVHRTGDTWLQYDDESGVMISEADERSENIRIKKRLFLWHGDIGCIVQAGDDSVLVKLMAERRPLNPVLIPDKDYIKALSDKDRESQTVNMLQLAIDHGRFPDEDGYDYTVVPGISLADFQRFYVEPSDSNRLNRIDVLQNDDKAHVVYHAELGIYGLVFFEAGAVKLPEGRTIEVNEPLVLMVKEPEKKGLPYTGYAVYAEFRGLAPSSMLTPEIPYIGKPLDSVVIKHTGFSSEVEKQQTVPLNTALSEEGSTVKFSL